MNKMPPELRLRLVLIVRDILGDLETDDARIDIAIDSLTSWLRENHSLPLTTEGYTEATVVAVGVAVAYLAVTYSEFSPMAEPIKDALVLLKQWQQSLRPEHSHPKNSKNK